MHMDSTSPQIPRADQIQSLITFFLREPIREAVRAELREQGVAGTGDNSSMTDVPVDSTEDSESTSSSMPSKLPVGVVVLGLAGVVYWLRRGSTEDPAEPSGRETRVTGPNREMDSETPASAPTE